MAIKTPQHQSTRCLHMENLATMLASPLVKRGSIIECLEDFSSLHVDDPYRNAIPSNSSASELYQLLLDITLCLQCQNITTSSSFFFQGCFKDNACYSKYLLRSGEDFMGALSKHSMLIGDNGPSTLALAMVYIRKLVVEESLIVDSTTFPTVLFACVVFASKMCNDNPYDNISMMRGLWNGPLPSTEFSAHCYYLERILYHRLGIMPYRGGGVELGFTGFDQYDANTQSVTTLEHWDGKHTSTMLTDESTCNVHSNYMTLLEWTDSIRLYDPSCKLQ